MAMSLIGIVLGIAFFIVTQAQTSGFQNFFIETILGTNGAIKISDRFQDLDGTVSKTSSTGEFTFNLKSREHLKYFEGVDYPEKIRKALNQFNSISGISEVIESNGILSTKSRNQTVQIFGIEVDEHIKVSNLRDQLRAGSINKFSGDQMGILIGQKIADRMKISIDDRINLAGKTESFQLRVSGIFETGVSEIDKKRIYIPLTTCRTLNGKRFGGSNFQIGLINPNKAPEIALQIQETIGHRAVSWQEREKVWLDVFKALRISSAITVSSILLLSGLGIFNVFAIMVIEKTRDIAILRSVGLFPKDISAIFLWQGIIILILGIFLGTGLGALITFIISEIPLKIRGIFTTDNFVVNWDISHYIWAISIAAFFVTIASWIPARRASKVEPAKIIRETV